MEAAGHDGLGSAPAPRDGDAAQIRVGSAEKKSLPRGGEMGGGEGGKEGGGKRNEHEGWRRALYKSEREWRWEGTRENGGGKGHAKVEVGRDTRKWRWEGTREKSGRRHEPREWEEIFTCLMSC